jgi:hypothetical protein
VTQKDLYGNDTMEVWRTIKEQVREILKRFPEARNNDFYLQWLWLKYYAGISVALPFLPIEDIKKVGGHLETVRRTRQEIQNDEGQYEADDDVKRARRKKQKEVRDRRRDEHGLG